MVSTVKGDEIHVHVKLHYALSSMIGEKPESIVRDFILPAKATVCDMMDALVDEFGAAFAQIIYSPAEKRCVAEVSIIRNNTLCDQSKIEELELRQDEDVFICPIYRGG